MMRQATLIKPADASIPSLFQHANATYALQLCTLPQLAGGWLFEVEGLGVEPPELLWPCVKRARISLVVLLRLSRQRLETAAQRDLSVSPILLLLALLPPCMRTLSEGDAGWPSCATLGRVSWVRVAGGQLLGMLSGVIARASAAGVFLLALLAPAPVTGRALDCVAFRI